MTIGRVVIVPEFQGFGIGIKFMNEIAKIWENKGFRVRITTSLKPFMQALKKHKNWKCKRFGRIKGGSLINTSQSRVTASFQYKA